MRGGGGGGGRSEELPSGARPASTYQLGRGFSELFEVEALCKRRGRTEGMRPTLDELEEAMEGGGDAADVVLARGDIGGGDAADDDDPAPGLCAV